MTSMSWNTATLHASSRLCVEINRSKRPRNLICARVAVVAEVPLVEERDPRLLMVRQPRRLAEGSGSADQHVGDDEVRGASTSREKRSSTKGGEKPRVRGVVTRSIGTEARP